MFGIQECISRMHDLNFLSINLQEQTWIFRGGIRLRGRKGSRKVIKVLSTSNIPFNVIQLFSDGGLDLE